MASTSPHLEGVDLVGDRPTPSLSANHGSGLIRIRPLRHTSAVPKQLVFCCWNVRSANNKVDDILDIRRQHGLDVMLLTESWHDSDSVCVRRLRAEGLQVLERARPRARSSSLSVNHGGVIIAASPGVSVSSVTLGSEPAISTFEYLCARLVSKGSACTVLLVYRPGSAVVGASFFCEFGSILDTLSTLRSEPLIIAGDFNIRLDRPESPHCQQLLDIFTVHGLRCHVSSPTHDCGGLLDIVATRDDLVAPTVDILDVGISDHRLLRWTSCLQRPPPTYHTFSYRPWRRVCVDDFRTALCQTSIYSDTVLLSDDSGVDVDDLAELYNRVTNELADQFAPIKQVSCRQRQDNQWFDDECRAARMRCRQLERRSHHLPGIYAEWKCQLRSYRQLVNRKRSDFWRLTIDSQKSSPRQLWHSIDRLLGRGRLPASTSISATDFQKFFDDKIAGVRASTDGSAAPDFQPVPDNCNFDVFHPVDIGEVISLISSLPNKQCLSDPLPTWLLKACSAEVAPFICKLLNASLSAGLVPSSFKSAYITPLLKKPGLDNTDVKNYRPISNLSVLSKLLERVVLYRLCHYLRVNDLMPRLQSAYRAHHSTETALAKVLSDILMSLDKGNIAALAFLDLSAAFDTVDHDTLLHRLQFSFGITGKVLSWLHSYLTDRRTCVLHAGVLTSFVLVLYGVPQGSVLGPLLFLLYISALERLVLDHHLSPHQYADDSQVYGSCPPCYAPVLTDTITRCVNAIELWMRSNRLQLNTSKTEFLWCAPPRRRHLIPPGDLLFDQDAVNPVSSVRNLGVYIDGTLTMRTHINYVLSSCFGSLRQIKTIKRSLPSDVVKTLVTSFVHSRLDYCNVVFAGLPNCDLNRLQSVLNSAVRLVAGARRWDHVTPLLRDHHWLPIRERVIYKLCTLVHRCVHSCAPTYLTELIVPLDSSRSRSGLRSADSLMVAVPRTCSSLGDRAFAAAAPRAWNDLPRDLRAIESSANFRQHLKTFLFSVAYS